eukprot:scaffold431_cov103-Cylindrotheca_fusiformis.AAC.3
MRMYRDGSSLLNTNFPIHASFKNTPEPTIHPMDLEPTRPGHCNQASPTGARDLLTLESSARRRRMRNMGTESRTPITQRSRLLAMTALPSGSSRPVMIQQGRNQLVASILDEALDIVYAFSETSTVDERSRRSTNEHLNGSEERQ